MSFGAKKDLMTHHICLLRTRTSKALLLLCASAATWGKSEQSNYKILL